MYVYKPGSLPSPPCVFTWRARARPPPLLYVCNHGHRRPCNPRVYPRICTYGNERIRNSTGDWNARNNVDKRWMKSFSLFLAPLRKFSKRKRNNAAVIEGISREERRFRAFVGISEKYTLSSFLFSFWRKIEDRLEIDWRTECARMRDSRLRACTRACAALRVIDVVRARYLRSMPVCTAKHTRCVSSRAAYTMQRARWLMTCKGTVQRETETHTREFTRGASLHNRVSPRKICLSPPLSTTASL